MVCILITSLLDDVTIYQCPLITPAQRLELMQTQSLALTILLGDADEYCTFICEASLKEQFKINTLSLNFKGNKEYEMKAQ